MMLVPRRNFDIFDDVFDEPFFTKHENKLMKTDIKEHKDKFELIIDLPGIKKEDIKIHIEDGYLEINAKTNIEDESNEENGKYVHKERYYGECSRSFYVGNDVLEDEIKANFKNGTLIVEIPKKDKKISNNKKYIEITE